MGTRKKMPFGWNAKILFVERQIAKIFEVFVLLRSSIREVIGSYWALTDRLDEVLNNSGGSVNRDRVVVETIRDYCKTFVNDRLVFAKINNNRIHGSLVVIPVETGNRLLHNESVVSSEIANYKKFTCFQVFSQIFEILSLLFGNESMIW